MDPAEWRRSVGTTTTRRYGVAIIIIIIMQTRRRSIRPSHDSVIQTTRVPRDRHRHLIDVYTDRTCLVSTRVRPVQRTDRTWTYRTRVTADDVVYRNRRVSRASVGKKRRFDITITSLVGRRRSSTKIRQRSIMIVLEFNLTLHCYLISLSRYKTITTIGNERIFR